MHQRAQPARIEERDLAQVDDDEQRAAYIRRGLDLTKQAIARGIDVRGFFHWTGVDNYEWIHGYDVQFGIIDRDRNVRPSALVLMEASGG